MKLRDIILAIFIALIWGSFFTVSKISLNSFPILFFSGLRFSLIFLATSPFFFREKIPIIPVVTLSVVTVLNIFAFNYAINLSSSLSPIILLNEIAVPFSTLLGVYYFKEKFYCKEFVGIAIALIGVAVVVEKRPTEEVSIYAIILIITASLLFAFYNLLVKKLARFNIFTLLSQISFLIAVQFLVASFFQEDWALLNNIQSQSIYALLYSTVICGIFAQYCWFYLLNKYPLGKIVPFTLLSPIFGCITSILILKESVSYEVLFGGLLVILGLIIIELKNVKKK